MLCKPTFGLSLCYKNPLCFPCFASSRKQGDYDYDIHWSGRVMEFLSCWYACDKVNMLKQCLYSPFIPTKQLQRQTSKLLNLTFIFKFASERGFRPDPDTTQHQQSPADALTDYSRNIGRTDYHGLLVHLGAITRECSETGIWREPIIDCERLECQPDLRWATTPANTNATLPCPAGQQGHRVRHRWCF